MNNYDNNIDILAKLKELTLLADIFIVIIRM